MARTNIKDKNICKKFIYILSADILGHNILHLDYYIEQDRNKNNIWIYWVDFEDGQNNGIYRSHPDGSEKQHIISVSFN